VHRFSDGQVGIACTDFLAHDDAARHLAGPDAGGLSHRRFEHAHHYAADAVLPAGGRVLSAIRQAIGHRYCHGDDAALLRDVSDLLDAAPAAVLGGRSTAGSAVELHVPALEAR